jgi:hypothetical protein
MTYTFFSKNSSASVSITAPSLAEAWDELKTIVIDVDSFESEDEED